VGNLFPHHRLRGTRKIKGKGEELRKIEKQEV
jgi:hypothetical protein